MEIEKAYFTLVEILERWRISQADLIYLAENDRLRLSVRVYNVPVEFGDYEQTEGGEPFRAPWEQARYSGLLDLHACDAFQLFRCSELHATEFRTPRAHYASVMSHGEPVFLMIGDLLLRREERDRFEAEVLRTLRAGNNVFGEFSSIDFNGKRYRFTPTQTRVLRFLYDAALNGEPWQLGKAALAAGGSASLKLGDLFKRRPEWRDLVEADGRGFYRINPALLQRLAA